MSGDDLSLRILDVEPGDEIAGARCLRLRTTRGEIPIIVHAPEVQPVEVGAAERRRQMTLPPAPYCASAARSAGSTVPESSTCGWGRSCRALGITVVRLNYRMPNEFGECVLDTMAGLDVSQRDAIRTRGDRRPLLRRRGRDQRGHARSDGNDRGRGFEPARRRARGRRACAAPAVPAARHRRHDFAARMFREDLRARARSRGRSSFFPASAIASPKRPTNCSKPSATGCSTHL